MKKAIDEKPFFIQTKRGRIFAMYNRGNPNKPLVLLLHGYRGSHLGTYTCFFTFAARKLSGNGYNVIRFDFIGSGNSDGLFEMQTTKTMVRDVIDVLNYCEKNFYYNGVVLIGHSRGFYVSLLVNREIKDLIGMVSWMGRIRSLDEFLSKMEIDYFKKIDKSFKNRINAEKSHDWRGLIRRVRVPVLLIYGKRDNVVFYTEATIFKKYYRGKRLEIRIIDELEHDFKNASDNVLRYTINFLKSL